MQPLAERLRPKTLDEYIGQKHLVGPGAVLRKMIDAGRISSFILWGPPGVGKTTLAQIIANKLETPFYTLSAVTSGVKDVRDVIDRAKSNRFFSQASPILFIDEIHRFSKSQQDSLLGAVEQGTVTLIGATTENPSFEVIRPLLSRCQLYVLKSLEKDDLLELLQRAITTDVQLKERHNIPSVRQRLSARVTPLSAAERPFTALTGLTETVAAVRIRGRRSTLAVRNARAASSAAPSRAPPTVGSHSTPAAAAAAEALSVVAAIGL